MKEGKINKEAKFILFVFFILNLVVWLIAWHLSDDGFLELTFFDIGQGDAIFIEAPNKNQILIDGGPEPGLLLEKLSERMPFYDRKIELVVLTHPEHDHYRGLFDVLETYDVENILWTGVIRDTDEWREWIHLIQEENSNIILAEKGKRIILQKNPFIFFDVLSPFENLYGRKMENSNDSSVVVRLVFGKNSFLLTGDISKKTERKLTEQYSNLKSEVLKVSHHGSKYSSDEVFLARVSPDLAVISCGRNNRYGHPYPEVLAILEKFGIRVLRTDINGDINIISDGNILKILNPNLRS